MASSGKDNIRKIVLLGKTGLGKSSLANTILGEKNVFMVCHDSVAGTKECLLVTRTVKGRDIQLIDTPGFFDKNTKTDEYKEKIIKTIIECAPNIHTFLLLLKLERYTEHEQAVVEEIKKHFSAEALKYTTVVFTHGDDLPEGTSIKEWAMKNEALTELLQSCGERCYVFDNKHWNNTEDPYRNNQVQLDELLNTIEDTVRKNGGVYTNKTLLKVAKDLQTERVRIREEQADVTEQEVELLARQTVFFSMWEKVAAVGAGAVVLGALLGLVLLRH